MGMKPTMTFLWGKSLSLQYEKLDETIFIDYFSQSVANYSTLTLCLNQNRSLTLITAKDIIPQPLNTALMPESKHLKCSTVNFAADQLRGHRRLPFNPFLKLTLPHARASLFLNILLVKERFPSRFHRAPWLCWRQRSIFGLQDQHCFSVPQTFFKAFSFFVCFVVLGLFYGKTVHTSCIRKLP